MNSLKSMIIHGKAVWIFTRDIY